MDKQNLKAENRKIIGRKVKNLRKEGYLPANIYGKDVKSQAVKVKLDDFVKVFRKTGETGLVELVVGGKKHPVLIHNIQRDPVSDSCVHVDFLQVDLKSKVVAQIPIELVGESGAEKEKGGTVVKHIDEIEVEALPTDLPEKFEIDLTSLKEIDESISVKDLKVDKKKIEIKNDPDQIIVKAEPPRKEEEVEPAPTEEEGETQEGDADTPEEGKTADSDTKVDQGAEKSEKPASAEKKLKEEKK